MSSDWMYLAEIDAWNPATPGVETLRFGSTGYVTTPSETPANAYYEPRIKQPALYRFDAGVGKNTSRGGYGELVLANPDRGLDGYVNYGFDGRALRLLAGPVGSAYSALTVLLRGTCLGVTWERSTVSIRIRDRQEELNKPLQTTKYGGTNSLPAGIDGVADDLKGRVKPLLYGTVLNVAPPCVNTSRLIYQLHDAALQAVTAVYDNGVALTAGATYADQATMEATAPSAGGYRVWLAGGMVRLGSSPAGPITADASEGSSAALRYPGSLLNRIALKAGLTAGEISSADVSALDTACPYECGVFLGDETATATALDTVLAAGYGFWYFDAAGILRCNALTAPTGAPVLTLEEYGILELDRTASGSGDNGLPVKVLNLKYARNGSVQTSVAGAVTAARREWLKLEYRTVTVTDSAVATKHLLAPTLDWETPIVSAANAATELTRLQGLICVRRDTLRVTTRIPDALAATIGTVVRVKVPRLGYDAGRDFRVIGIEQDAIRDRITLTLWG
ncbi:hypothetical protein [Candidatus Contendibacter odensensis]|uniref:Tip attachment protein J domain-containing protein n=1 Tax=Candidatus Contendobacter odensis Run_B_J11 TaxID=1400861 RepID=A0A7U7G8H1_9GAMM|nr:hypothetical protein [Candidatus Contendobacter odensis]CDH43861.1 conserved hypothetical protein [Candidatus Contendobacter odensis Run_B_J11]